ncbi:MAG: ATP-binding protein [Lachnospiraceae bacterium]
MKLKTKLIVSFCIILFVPFLLAAIALFGVTNVQMRQIEKNYGISDVNIIANSMQLMSRSAKDVYQELCHVAETDPNKMQDQTYLDEVNTKLEENNSYLIVRLNDVFLYCGEPKGLAEIEAMLPAYGKGEANSEKGIYIGGKQQSLIYQIDFKINEKEIGSAYLVVSGKHMRPEIKKLLADIVIAVLLILMATAVLLSIWNYTSIITPIKKLQAAAQNIKEGNLDFTIEVESKDEIGQLCQDFEDMRKRLKESAEEKLESEKENKELISNISHDLKTPITAIKGYVEGIMDGVADTPQKQEKYIRTIYNKANEMNLLINELTLYSQIDTNRIPYNFKRLNLSEYFTDCVEELGLELESKNIQFSYFNYVDENVQIIADPEQLSRVIHNIVGNSIKYLDKEHGCINLRIKDVGDFVQFEIEDNGKGIATKDLPYIFERFYRADASRNSATGGSGIGLSIVKKIMEDHGGKIWATSKEKTGTVMYFVLRKYQEVPMNE